MTSHLTSSDTQSVESCLTITHDPCDLCNLWPDHCSPSGSTLFPAAPMTYVTRDLWPDLCSPFPQHFVCAKCEKPFLGHRHYEKKGQAYCRTDYHMLFGNICFVCNYVVEDEGRPILIRTEVALISVGSLWQEILSFARSIMVLFCCYFVAINQVRRKRLCKDKERSVSMSEL